MEQPAPSKPRESSVIGTTVKDAMWSFGGAMKRVVLDDLGAPVKSLRAGHIGRAALDVPVHAIGGTVLDITEGVAGSIGAVLGVGFDKKIAKDGLSGVAKTPGKLWKNSISPITAFREGHSVLGKIGLALWAIPKDMLWGNLRDAVVGIGNFLKPLTAFNLRKDAGLTGLVYKGLVALAKKPAPPAPAQHAALAKKPAPVAAPAAPHAPQAQHAAHAAHQDHDHAAAA